MKQIATSSNNNAVQQFSFFDADQFAVMQRVSKMFSMSELVPDMYKASEKVSPEKAMANCMIALSLAQRMGADALMVMQNLIIIYGRPSWSSKFLIATVNTCGRFETLKYEFKNLGKVGKIELTEYVWNNGKKVPSKIMFDGTEIDNIQCVAFTREKGSEDRLDSSEVTIKMAIEEGWYTKNGSKWKTMPKKMLTYRAASFWTNEYAPEISMGMRTEEEAHDIGIEDIQYEDVSEKVNEEINTKAHKNTMSFDQASEAESNKNKGAEGESVKEAETKAPEKQPELAVPGQQEMPDIFK